MAGLRVLSLESRRAKEIGALIQREGGDPFVAPSVQERAADRAEGLHFLDRLESGEFDLVICMTGVGLGFLRDQLAPMGALERLSNALRKVTVLARGPKPLPVLRELGVKADILVPEPNTWREILAAVAVRPERRILVQEYGRPNLELTATLEGLGAQVTPLVVYKWELPDDCEPLREAARQLAARTFDVVMFTSSIQLEHLLQIAREQGVEAQVIDALRHYTAVASVGPVMSDSLRAAGLPVDIEPAHPKMAPLTKAALTGAGPVLTAKRG